jgi:Golgi phosphoprotein 3
MNLFLHESILLLALDDEKGKFTSAGTYLHYGFATALIMDLILAERIIVEDDRIVVKTNATTHSKVLNNVLHRLQESKKTRKVTYWIQYLVQRISKLESQAIEQLIKRNILERRQEKLLWVFDVNRYPSVNTKPENLLRARLREIIFEDVSPEPHERMLLVILQTCQLDKKLIPGKAERKKAGEKIKALTHDSEIGKYVSDAILEMQMAVIVATTAAIS